MFRKFANPLLLVCWMVLSACAPVLSPLPATATPTLTLEPTLTPVPAETPTPEPTATPEAVNENDIKPVFSLPFSERVVLGGNGPLISGSLDTDKSLTAIREVSMPESAAAKAMFMIIHEVYGSQHPGVTIEQYARMVREVQDGARDPLEIGVLMYANDLDDGKPYKTEEGNVNPEAQEQYLIIPWYDGSVPEESDGIKVKAVNEIDVVFVKTTRVENITMVSSPNNDGTRSFESGYGINFSTKDKKILFYVGPGSSFDAGHPLQVIGALQALDWFIKKNVGRPLTFGMKPEFKELVELLKNTPIIVK